jgi:hypothetical protein
LDDNELILALHDMMERVEKARGVNAAGAHDVLVELLEQAAEERGAFLAEATL